MEKEKNKEKKHILSGFFDRCVESADGDSKPMNYFGLREDEKHYVPQNKAEDKLKKIKRILEE